MKVLLVGESLAFEASVRRMVGAEAQIDALSADEKEADLVVVEASRMTPRLLDRLGKQIGSAAILVLAEEGRPFRVQPMPPNLARLKYREVVERVGRHVVREYLDALLTEQAGNVTKAALAAGLERESLHRLMRRYRIDATSYRREDA